MLKSKRIKLDTPEAFLTAVNRMELVRSTKESRVQNEIKIVQS